MNELIIIQMTKAELQTFVEDAIKNYMKNSPKTFEPEKPIKGIHALAAFLNISVSRAMKLKKSGIIPFFQSSRLVLFDPIKVREALANHKIQPKKWTRIDLSKL